MIKFYFQRPDGSEEVTAAESLPSGAIELTNAQYDGLLEGSLAMVNGVITSSAPSAAQLLFRAQAARIAFIEQEYETREHADIVYLGATFQAGDESQKLIDRVLAAQNGAAPAGFGWYDITNTKVQMTNAELQGLANAIFLRNQPLFDNKQAKKAAIRAAATVAEVEAITW